MTKTFFYPLNYTDLAPSALSICLNYIDAVHFDTLSFRYSFFDILFDRHSTFNIARYFASKTLPFYILCIPYFVMGCYVIRYSALLMFRILDILRLGILRLRFSAFDVLFFDILPDVRKSYLYSDCTVVRVTSVATQRRRANSRNYWMI